MIDLADPGADAASVIRALDLRPHPEGGHFRETWRDVPAGGGSPQASTGGNPGGLAGGAVANQPMGGSRGDSRGAGTAILFLLAAGQRSHWHRVDAAEMWLWQAGAPLTLSIHPAEDIVLGPNLAAGHALQGLVPKGHWQAARSLGAWTLVSCVVTPAFMFEGFELAPPGWSPT